MQICNKNHSNIVFEIESCPLCSLIDNKDKIIKLEKEISKLEDSLQDSESEIDNLKQQLLIKEWRPEHNNSRHIINILIYLELTYVKLPLINLRPKLFIKLPDPYLDLVL